MSAPFLWLRLGGLLGGKYDLVEKIFPNSGQVCSLEIMKA